MEPEIGLGMISKVDERSITILFSASEEMRQYAVRSAPLRRVEFSIGDTVKSRTGQSFKVTSLSSENGLLIYTGTSVSIRENELCDSISFNESEVRLRSGQVDPSFAFDLRFEAMKNRYRYLKSDVMGFIGGRIDLIPHQLYIAHETASRYVPRVLLSDEVGLGKTIEAGLIIHRLIRSARMGRILILVPESLVHQWFIEMYRRFNLWFNIFDEDRCIAVEGNSSGENPFLDDQLVLTSIDFLTNNKKRRQQAIDAGWEMLVVDEAHHLEWSKDNVSEEYNVVEKLSRDTRGLLLLTATPEQLGLESHFARLRLLDPDRYYSLDAFVEESSNYQEVAGVADRLLSNEPLTSSCKKHLEDIFAEDTDSVRKRISQVDNGDLEVRQSLINDMLDQHGTGRVMFRNTRQRMKGFPKRKAHLIPLPSGDTDMDELVRDFAIISGQNAEKPKYKYKKDARLKHLIELLKNLDGEKLVLICNTREKVAAIDKGLRSLINIKIAQFHEDLTLVQRDRNAAWFAEVDGADILICSEIGSEGRNFQFAHHLLLFDVPFDLELLEQRIGRLDRIGQTADINVHIPYVIGSPQEVLVRWCHEGLCAFEHNLVGGNQYLKPFNHRIKTLAKSSMANNFENDLLALIEETQVYHKELAAKLERGRDHLLELNSFNNAISADLVEKISEHDASPDLDRFMMDIFDHYGLKVETISRHAYLLNMGDLQTEAFPCLNNDGMIVTTSREKALSREDYGLLTWDHPMVSGAIDLLLGSAQGNSSFAIWLDPKGREIILEMVFVVECLAPNHLHVDRFLPPTPLRIVVNNSMKSKSSEYTSQLFEEKLRIANPERLFENKQVGNELIPQMLETGQGIAEKAKPTVIKRALDAMEKSLGHDIERLQALRKINNNVTAEEIETAQAQRSHLVGYIGSARLRLDSLRLVWRGPELESVL